MKGRHTGSRTGDGLFYLFHAELGVADHLGPGTRGDAGNNGTAKRLAMLFNSRLDGDTLGSDVVGCLCHIANIAALKYLEGECKYLA
jgi:hypothetical protein